MVSSVSVSVDFFPFARALRARGGGAGLCLCAEGWKDIELLLRSPVGDSELELAVDFFNAELFFRCTTLGVPFCRRYCSISDLGVMGVVRVIYFFLGLLKLLKLLRLLGYET